MKASPNEGAAFDFKFEELERVSLTCAPTSWGFFYFQALYSKNKERVMASAIVIAGTHSGAGKTTVSLGLMQAFTRMGLKVQPFKVGPDFIDPSLHTQVCGRDSRNLDSFLTSGETVRHLFHRAASQADLSIIEGVGGLYDGYSGKDPKGSTAEIAALLDCPVLLVCDAYSSSRSIAAVVKGFVAFQPRVRIVGVVLNRIANPTHWEWCETAIREATGLPVVGALYHSPPLALRERHLGLIPAAEKNLDKKWLQELSKQINENFDIKNILKISQYKNRSHFLKGRAGKIQIGIRQNVRIGIARDEAFSFYYKDNLDLLEDLGAELVPFSPLMDAQLPKGLTGLYLGGGFPEIYAKALACSQGIQRQIAKAAAQGMPLYAECGGLMYLGKKLKDQNRKVHKMTGILPFSTEMTGDISMGYVRAQSRRDHLLGRKGESFPGQVFHFSKMIPAVPSQSLSRLPYAYELSNGRRTFRDGIATGNLLASYMHVHFWSKPSLAANFVDRCAQWKAA